MGLFDRLRSIVGSTASVDLRGPLGLGLGDGVAYYREQFTVAGVRRLQGDGARVDTIWHYCMRDPEGERAVLVVEAGAEPRLWMHRVVAAEIPWDQDVIEGVADEPFKLASRGQAAVLMTGDVGVPQARTVSFRVFADASAERVVVLEDWGGHRESRVGEMIHEAEITLTKTDEPDGGPDASWWDAAPATDQARGSPAAAAAALGGRQDEPHDVAEVVPHEDQDPTAFSDENWDDDRAEDPVPVAASPIANVFDTEADEWRAAALYLREHGIPADRK